MFNKNVSVYLDSWGDTFPAADPDWDLVIASDILLCKFLILSPANLITPFTEMRSYLIQLIL